MALNKSRKIRKTRG